MKLHKLLYFAQRENIAIVNAPLFDGEFEGWNTVLPISTVSNKNNPDSEYDIELDPKMFQLWA